MSGRHDHRISTDQLQTTSDEELLQLWLDGHDQGLDELVARHRPWMLRLVRTVSIGEHDPEAIVQDVWLDVMRAAATFRGDGSVRAWLKTMVRRRIITTWRGRDARPQTLVDFVPEDTTAPEEIEDRVAVREQLRGVLAAVPTDQRDAIWAVDVLGLSVEEVAGLLGIPVGTVKSRCHRGRARLRLVIGGRS